ncbi:MAG: YeiH family protein [Clostridiaceae bacterium]
MIQIKKFAPGILLCLTIAIPADYLGQAYPIIGGPVFGMLIGMIITIIYPEVLTTKLLFNSKKSVPEQFKFNTGVKYTSKKLLQYSIILLGFGMNLFNVIKIGGQSLFVILFTLSASFLTAFFMSKILKIKGTMATLMGVGISICGGSAIAATAPVIQAGDADISHAISTIFLFNILAVFIFPALGHLWGMSDMGFGMWAGTAINDTSSVVAAGASWSNSAGNNTALAFATIVKLTRTLMIVPITLVLSIYTAQKNKKNSHNTFKLSKVFPWFIFGFIGAAIANTFAGIPESTSHWLASAGKFVIVMAMSAIGLNTNLKKLFTNSIKPIFLGLCCWFAVAGVSLLVQAMMNIL